MKTILENNLNKYIVINADCIPVKGATRSAIYDLTRGELTFFPSDYFYLLANLENKNGKAILAHLDHLSDESEIEAYFQIINFLFESEFATMTTHPERFPKIEPGWEIPGIINDAIIDIDQTVHNMGKILNDLDELGCRYLQIRSFSNLLTLEEIEAVLKNVLHKSIQGVELILKYDPKITDDQYKALRYQNPILSSLIIHSCNEKRELFIDFGVHEEIKPYVQKVVQFHKTPITSESHCGVITETNLSIPSISSFFENLSFNGCLNRKIAIDKNGSIKNCPSMQEDYGNINDTSLKQALENSNFTKLWSINKDQIDTCRDCELRYICSDCRAYTQKITSGQHPKPLKCAYNPYTAEWGN